MKITFLPQNITREAEAGETILMAAVKAGVNIGCLLYTSNEVILEVE